MKDYFNPLLLLVIIALLSWKVSVGIETPTSVEVWLLSLCATGCIVNGLLSVARALARRKALMSVTWAAVYLVFCSCAWVTLRQEKDYRHEIDAYNTLNTQWQQENKNPFTLVDAEGRSLLELAAILGKKLAVRGLLAQPEAAQAQDVILKAAINAAENGRHELLTIISQQQGGFNFDRIIEGRTPLISAVLSNNKKCVEVLLTLGVDPDLCDDSGVSPIMHAVIDNNRSIASLLMQYGADPYQKDTTGRDAASCSRSNLMDAILIPEN